MAWFRQCNSSLLWNFIFKFHVHVLSGCRQKPNDCQLCRFQNGCLVILNNVQLQSTHCPLPPSPMGQGYPSRSQIYNFYFSFRLTGWRVVFHWLCLSVCQIFDLYVNNPSHIASWGVYNNVHFNGWISCVCTANKSILSHSIIKILSSIDRSIWRINKKCFTMIRWSVVSNKLMARVCFLVSFMSSEFGMCPYLTQITRFMGPTWGPPGSCQPQMGPMLALWTMLSG